MCSQLPNCVCDAEDRRPVDMDDIMSKPLYSRRQLEAENARLRALMSDDAQPEKEKIAAIVLSAILGKADGETYGASHARKMNEDRAEKAAERIFALAAQPPAAPVETDAAVTKCPRCDGWGYAPPVETYSCPCGVGEEPCPGTDGKPACAVSRSSAGRETELLATLVYEAMRFSIWAAGQGIMAMPGEPTRDPEDFLYEYAKALDIDEWDGLPEVARDHIRAVPQESREKIVEECANIADDHTPAKHEGTLAAHVTGSTIAKAIRALALSRPQPQGAYERALELLEERPAAALRALVIEECAKVVDSYGAAVDFVAANVRALASSPLSRPEHS